MANKQAHRAKHVHDLVASVGVWLRAKNGIQCRGYVQMIEAPPSTLLKSDINVVKNTC